MLRSCMKMKYVPPFYSIHPVALPTATHNIIVALTSTSCYAVVRTQLRANRDKTNQDKTVQMSNPLAKLPFFACCWDCGREFQDRDGLEVHLAADHLEWLPYKCRFCPHTRLATENSLVQHFRKDHPMENIVVCGIELIRTNYFQLLV